ncbi:MAG: hypothetical protein IJL02_11430 [Methanobrevibacter sp.]|uniref:hypothetical protein n=1 Tax=Methanobrevibacter sp. TaxID=66852 RepID=UPI0025DD4AE6|nr:hypothetical protein [Methanobrevibacter sp.]MBQ6100457.1 hypothetical protein [Methanobrevibacter sp.]
MSRDIHDIFDVIMKIIATVYGNDFLRYIGIKGELKKELKTEITTIKGKKLYLDFLCELNDGTIHNFEFQYPKATSNDLERFFGYNILVEVRYQTLTETVIINFGHRKNPEEIKRIGKTKCFNPQYFYLGDIDFDEIMEKINIKVKSEKRLTASEEITLMIMCIVSDCKNKAQKLKGLCKLLKKKELFDESRFEFIESVVKLEIDNLLTEKEKQDIKKEIKMTPQALSTIQRAIDEVNKKVISEAKMEGEAKGMEKGMEKGIEKGRKESMQEIAKAFKDKIDIEELSQATGLSIDEINQL